MASKPNDTVRVAVVGMGIGKPNGQALANNPRGQVVALCDLVEERMQSFASDLPEPVKFYTDYKEMCRDDEIDADGKTLGLLDFKTKHIAVVPPIIAGPKVRDAIIDGGVVSHINRSLTFGNPRH